MLSRKQFMSQPANRKLSAEQKNKKWLKYLATSQNKKKMALANSVNNRQQQMKAKPQMSHVKLSHCLLDYARASIDPWDVNIDQPCIPDGVCIPSYKLKTVCNGQAIVGTNGVALIAYCPWLMFSGDNSATASYVEYPVVTTTSTYDYSDIRLTAAEHAAGKLSGSNSNSYLKVYSPPSVDDSPMRLVAAGVEVQYTGTTLNQSGAVTVIQSPGLEDWGLLQSFTGIRNIPTSKTCSVSKSSRCYVPYYPTNESVLAYEEYTNYFSSTRATASGLYHPLLIAINGGQPGETFQFKAIAFFESQLKGMGTTPSHSDPVGFGAFQTARTQFLPTEDASKDFFDIIKETGKTILKSISGVFPEAGTIIGASFGAPEVGALVGTSAKTALELLLDDKPRTI
jgi:hypothetical protein